MKSPSNNEIMGPSLPEGLPVGKIDGQGNPVEVDEGSQSAGTKTKKNINKFERYSRRGAQESSEVYREDSEETKKPPGKSVPKGGRKKINLADAQDELEEFKKELPKESESPESSDVLNPEKDAPSQEPSEKDSSNKTQKSSLENNSYGHEVVTDKNLAERMAYRDNHLRTIEQRYGSKSPKITKTRNSSEEEPDAVSDKPASPWSDGKEYEKRKGREKSVVKPDNNGIEVPQDKPLADGETGTKSPDETATKIEQLKKELKELGTPSSTFKIPSEEVGLMVEEKEKQIDALEKQMITVDSSDSSEPAEESPDKLDDVIKEKIKANNAKIDEIEARGQMPNSFVHNEPYLQERAEKEIARLRDEISELDGTKEKEEIKNKDEKLAYRREYLNLKKDAREARRVYEEALKNEYSERWKIAKLFGLGREKSSDEVKRLRLEKIEAEKKQIKFGNEGGIYKEIVDRENALRRSRGSEGIVLAAALSKRHVLNPAEKKMDLQTVHVKENLVKLKESLTKRIRGNSKAGAAIGAIATATIPAVAKAAPVAAKGLTAYKYTFNTVGAGLGFATAYLGGKFFTGKSEKRRDSLAVDSVKSFDSFDDLDLDKLESEYFSTVNEAHNRKNYTKMVSTAAAVLGGGVTNAYGEEIVDFVAGSNAVESVDGVDVASNGNNLDVVKNPDSVADVMNNSSGEGYDPNPDSVPEGDLSMTEVDGSGVDSNNADTLPDKNVASSEVKDLNLDSLNDPIKTPYDTVPDITPDIDSDAAVKELNLDVLDNEVETPYDKSPDITPDSADTISAQPESASAFEAIKTVETHDTMSRILYDALEDRFEAKKLQLPTGVTMDNLSHHMYQTFPEMTDATDFVAKLSPEDWVKLGVESGDPHKIFPGEEINVEALVKIMEGNPVNEVMDNLDNLDNLDTLDGDLDSNLTSSDSVETPHDTTPNITPNSEDSVSIESKTGDVSNIMSDEQVGYGKTITSGAEGGNNRSLEDLLNIDFEEGDYDLLGDYSDMKASPGEVFKSGGVEKYLVDKFVEGLNEFEIYIPDLLNKVESVNYSGNPGLLIEARLPELDPELMKTNDPALSAEIWKALGIVSGNPLEISMVDTLNTTALFEYILSGNEEALKIKLGLIK